MDRRNQRPIHVLVFPWLAQGHISPFLHLSKRLAIHGVKVSFLSTPANINRIKPLLQPPDWHSVDPQIYQLGVGLEGSQQPFLWVLRFPSSTDSHGDPQTRVRSSLPGGFENRTRDRGIVVSEWVPQPQIVSHRSVGCYLSHGRRSSVMEALTVGLPLILLPIKLDQSLNARFIVDVFMVGLEIEREVMARFPRTTFVVL